jgi:hypothetical protein
MMCQGFGCARLESHKGNQFQTALDGASITQSGAQVNPNRIGDAKNLYFAGAAFPKTL